MSSSFGASIRVLVPRCLRGGAAGVLLGALAACGRTGAPPSSLAPDLVRDSVEPAELAFEHKVGTSPCPQLVGTIRFRRGTENADFGVGFTAGKPLLLRFGTSGPLMQGISRGIVRMDELLLVEVWFDCSQQTSFTAGVVASDSDALRRDVTVRGTITR